MFTIAFALFAAALFVAMLCFQYLGKRLGERDRRSSEGQKTDYGPSEGAVFGLLGLFLAFTFSGAGTRFDTRRQLIVEEANAIGTAWLRVDLLPAARQPEVRDLFRQYVDSRLQTYRLVPDMRAVEAELARSQALQQRIWSASVAAARESGATPTFTLLLPALNAMIDITTTRTAVTRFHPPLMVFVTVAILALVGSILSGYGMAGRKSPSAIHRYGFALAMAIALFVIIDLEYPRLGLIHIDATDQLLADVRQSMH